MDVFSSIFFRYVNIYIALIKTIIYSLEYPLFCIRLMASACLTISPVAYFLTDCAELTINCFCYHQPTIKLLIWKAKEDNYIFAILC